MAKVPLNGLMIIFLMKAALLGMMKENGIITYSWQQRLQILIGLELGMELIWFSTAVEMIGLCLL